MLLEAVGVFGKGHGEVAPGDIYFLQFLHFCASNIVHIWIFAFHIFGHTVFSGEEVSNF